MSSALQLEVSLVKIAVDRLVTSSGSEFVPCITVNVCVRSWDLWSHPYTVIHSNIGSVAARCPAPDALLYHFLAVAGQISRRKK